MNEAGWFSLLAGFALKSTLVLGAAWLTSLALRSRSAAARHLIWTAAAAAVLALPYFSMSLPALRVPSLSTLAPGVAVLFEISTTAKPEAASSVDFRSRLQSHMRNQPWRPKWRESAVLLWAIGAAAFILQMLLAFAGLSRARRSARPSADSALAASLARELGVSHRVTVLESGEGSMPMTCGILKPVICMPSDAETWTEERRRMVLLHELAHIQRGDVSTHLLARWSLILNWWNPLAWFAWREFLKERERATDDLVLATGARASEYAAHLLDVARSMQTSPALAWPAVAMARRSELEGRLVAILDSSINRKAARRASIVVAIAAAVALIAPFAAVRAQDPTTQTIPSDIDATIRAAIAQNNYEMLDRPAEALETVRQFDAAKKLLDAALTIRQKSGGSGVAYGIGLIQLADLEKKRNQPKQAVPLYSEAVQVLGDKPEAAPALVFLGIDQLAKKEYAQAIDDFNRAQTVDSHQAAMAQMWVALAHQREANFAEADSIFRSALTMAEAHTDQEATIMEMYVRFFAEQGRHDEAKNMKFAAGEIRRKAVRESAAAKISSAVTPPKLLSKIEPDYTEEARVAKYDGTAVLFIEVGADGIVRNIQVARDLGFGLTQNAIAAVQQWRFQPAVNKAGESMAVQATVEVNFRLL
jgi:TonB family protein